MTGANRGLGAALTRALLADGWTVWAATRTGAEGPPPLGSGDLRPLSYEARDPAAPAAVAAAVAGRLDLLVNNAAIRHPSTLGSFDAETLADTFAVNVTAPLVLTRALLPALEQAGRSLVVMMSSVLGAVTLKNAEQGGRGVDEYAYPASKAALNLATAQLARDLLPRGIVVVAQSPGWVRTRMGGPHAPAEPSDVAARLVPLWRGVDDRSAGLLLDLDGTPLPFG